MAWPAYSIVDLAANSGRPEASYPSPFSTVAIAQALLLFKLYTCLKDWPTDPTQAELAKFAVLSMADAFVVSQPHALTIGNPFTSESIGSYSYSKAQKQLQAGLPTGLAWFDLAIQQLGVCESGPGGGIASGSLEVFENDGFFHVDSKGHKRLLGPKDIEPVDFPVLETDPRRSRP